MAKPKKDKKNKGGRVDFGVGTPVVLHGRKQVITVRESESVKAKVKAKE